jgi:hypothetical protein
MRPVNVAVEPADSPWVHTRMAEADHTGDVFLLGAGFARAISPTMPLLQDLAARITQTFENGRGIPSEVRSLMAENFAHALSYLEQAKPWVTEADNLRHRALFLDISNAIAHDLDHTVAKIGRPLAGRPPAWLAKLIRHWHTHRCCVITLNYDTLIEAAAARIQTGRSRISAGHLYPPLLTDAGLRGGEVQPHQRAETFRLLKLHGSTNWYYSGRAAAFGEPIFFVPPLPPAADRTARLKHEQRLRAVADKYPFLVPPIYDKSPLLTHETIRALWFEAGDALKRARRIVCMGYSLPESDLTMKHFLRTSCQPKVPFEIVNPAERARENFERLFRGANIQVDQCVTGRDCIAQFVKQRLTSR